MCGVNALRKATVQNNPLNAEYIRTKLAGSIYTVVRVGSSHAFSICKWITEYARPIISHSKALCLGFHDMDHGPGSFFSDHIYVCGNSYDVAQRTAPWISLSRVSQLTRFFFRFADAVDDQWYDLEVDGEPPCGRAYHSTVLIGSQLLIFGGWKVGSHPLSSH